MLVSICIPTYNNIDLFKRCLDSVLIQDYSEYEIIVADDSATNEIGHYVEGLKLPNLFYYHNFPSLGSPANWNLALSKAKGDYIKILHHDDYFTNKNSLNEFIKVLNDNPEADFVFSYSTIYFKKENSYFLHKQTRTQIKRLRTQPEFLFFRNIIGAPSVTFFRKDSKVMFDAKYKWLVDVEFYMSYLNKHKSFVLIEKPLVTVVDGESEQISQKVSKDKLVLIEEHLILFSEIFSKDIITKKSELFFQELFLEFDILDFESLKKQFKIPSNIEAFMKDVFRDLNRNKILKSIKKRLLTSRYNKRYFQIERF